MPVDPSATAELRRRAAELRRLATHIEATPLLELARRAGPDTWVSPRADALRAGLDTTRRRLTTAADDLRGHAHHLERRADLAEAASALTVAG